MKDDYLDSAGYSNWRMYQQGNGPCAVIPAIPSEKNSGEVRLRQ